MDIFVCQMIGPAKHRQLFIPARIGGESLFYFKALMRVAISLKNLSDFLVNLGISVQEKTSNSKTESILNFPSLKFLLDCSL
jgi:hypothetical protein